MSTLSYYINQLDNFDRTLNEPLVDVTWGRDIKLRTGVTMANESTSFVRNTYGQIGTMSATGMPFISQNSNTLPNISVDGERIIAPMRLLGTEISYTSIELERSQATNQPIDTQKLTALNQMYQQYTDQMVYVGSTEVGAKGLINSSLVTSTTVSTKAAGGTEWVTAAGVPNATPAECLADVNALLDAAWKASGYAICPDKLILPPADYSYITSQLVSSAGSVSIMKFLQDNSISNAINGRPLDIVPVKFATGAGAGGTNRMIAYTNNESRVRFPLVPMRRETTYFSGINYNAPYVWAFGEVEFVYPETVLYADGV